MFCAFRSAINPSKQKARLRRLTLSKNLVERGMATIDFEPVVEFPENPFDAARLYLALTAYPERGAGHLDGRGARFTAALWNYVVWDGRRHKGLVKAREQLGARGAEIPHRRDFEGALERGLRRIERRVAAFDIFGNQLVNGLLNGINRANAMVREGRAGEAFVRPPGSPGYNPIRREIIAAATPSPRQIIRRNLDRWSDRFSLNGPVQTADPTRKEKDLARRGYRESIPVMHLVHGLDRIAGEIAPTLAGWDHFDRILVLLWHSEQWVWEALRCAIRFRELAMLSDNGFPPHDAMIELIPPQKCAE